mgnify:CR=1 FL=1
MHPINYGLEGKVFVVTGGSRGIGFEIARCLLEQKARVVICGRKQNGLERAAEKLAAGKDLLPLAAHIAKTEAVDVLFDQTLQRFGRLDGLINNVGMNIISGVVDAVAGVLRRQRDVAAIAQKQRRIVGGDVVYR